MSDRIPIRRALLGVYDKTGIEELAAGLAAAGVELVSTGATARRIAEAGIPVTPVEQVTGFPECLDGRVKTLHPAVHAGILADRRKPEHVTQLDGARHRAVRPGRGEPLPVHRDGGLRGEPRRVRRADRHRRPGDGAGRGEEPPVGRRRRRPGPVRRRPDRRGRRRLHPRRAAEAGHATRSGTPRPTTSPSPPGWAACSRPRRTPSSRPGSGPAGSGPTCCATARTRTRAPRSTGASSPGLAHAEQLHGKAMSYNNYVDTDAAWRAAHDHADPCVAIIKHANPCGIAVGADIAAAHRKAHACDPISAFGGVIAANREVDLTMAEQVAEVFTEVVVAPSFTDDAVAVLTGEEEHPAAAAAARARRRAPRCGRSAAGCSCRSRTASTPPATTRPPGRWPPASRWTPPASTTWCSPGGRCAR